VVVERQGNERTRGPCSTGRRPCAWELEACRLRRRRPAVDSFLAYTSDLTSKQRHVYREAVTLARQ